MADVRHHARPRGAILVATVLVSACSAATPSDERIPTAGTTTPRSAAASASTESETATTTPNATPHPLAGESAWIAYQTNRTGEGIWLIHPDGSDDHEVATDIPREHLHPNWSPDGAQLVFTSRGEKDLLYELDVESGESRPLWPCDDPCLGDDEAVFSPDGTRIAFIRALLPFEGGAPSDCSLWLGDPETGEVEQVTSTPGCGRRETFPHWSPDGTRLAYYRGEYPSPDAVTSTAVYVLDLATVQERQLTPDEMFGGDSDWAPDGESLIFSTYPLNDFQCCRVSDLYRVGVDGSGLEPVTEYGSPTTRATQPRFTPDGTRILFTLVHSSTRELTVIPAAGGDAITIARGGIYTHGAWQP